MNGEVKTKLCELLLPRKGLTIVAVTIYCVQFSNRSMGTLIESTVVGISTS